MNRLDSNGDDKTEGGGVGYLVVGHGTRSRTGQDQVRAVFSQMTGIGGTVSLAGKPAELAFLELADPDISTAIERLAHAGVRELVVLPILLFSAGHATEDIPLAVDAASRRFGMKVMRQCSSLCLDPTIVSLSAERFFEALQHHTKLTQSSNLIDEGVALAMIGRGSNSEAATSAMLQFAELRTQATPVNWSSVGFIHAQRPTVDEALDGLAATGLPWLVVQPHLLFEGELIDELRREIAYRQSFSDSQQWIITETLGSGIDPRNLENSDYRLADALCKLALQSTAIDRSHNEAECSRCHQTNQWCRLEI